MSLEYVANRLSILKLKKMHSYSIHKLTDSGDGDVAYVIVVLNKSAIACEICVSPEY